MSPRPAATALGPRSRHPTARGRAPPAAGPPSPIDRAPEAIPPASTLPRALIQAPTHKSSYVPASSPASSRPSSPGAIAILHRRHELLAAFLHRAVYQAGMSLLHPPAARHSVSPRVEQRAIADHRHQPSRVPPPSLCLPRCPSVPATSHRPSTPSAPSAVPFSAELRGSLPSWLCFRPRALLQVMPCRRRLAVRNSSAESLLSLPELPPPSVPHQ
jgi:hypothetical protein